jgi:signal transduction histidine kinase
VLLGERGPPQPKYKLEPVSGIVAEFGLRTALQMTRKASNDATSMAQLREIMERQLGQLVRLVYDLLNIARVTSGQIALQKERVALQEILQSAVEASEPLRMTTKNSLTLKLPAEPLHLEADPTRRPNPPGKSQSLNRHSWHLNQGEAGIGTSIPSRN